MDEKRVIFGVYDSIGILGNFGSILKNFFGFLDGFEVGMGMNYCIVFERRKLGYFVNCKNNVCR